MGTVMGTFGAKGSKKCATYRNIPYTITPPQWWFTAFMSLNQILSLPSECCSQNQDSLDQAKCPILVSLRKLNPWAPVLRFLDTFLHWMKFVIISSTNVFLLAWNSPLTSDINRAICPTEVLLTVNFLLFVFLCKQQFCTWGSKT